MSIVGILVGMHTFRNIKSGKTGNEKLHLYNKAANKHGLIPIYLCLEHMNPSSGTAYGYKYAKGTYKLLNISIPKVIHNRTMPTSKRMRNRLKYVKRKCIVFNAQSRYSKYRIYQLIKNAFYSHLPITTYYTRSNLRKMMRSYNSLYIKPQSSSIGNGIMKATRNHNGKWKLQLPQGSLVAYQPLIEKKVDTIAKQRKYLIQETIPLAKYKGNPYDIRVSVQRGIGGNWQVTGMVGKVARKGSHVTNVARGGTVMKCIPLFASSVKAPSAAIRSVKRVSLDITRYLGNRLPHLADVGLDMGVNSMGKPYFIEMNCRDQRYSFKKARMSETFYRTYETPILYAKYLLSNPTKKTNSRSG